MGGEDAAAGEVSEHPLATGFDAVDGLAGERSVVVETREQRVVGTEAGDGAAGQGAGEGAGGAEDGVALGHGSDSSELEGAAGLWMNVEESGKVTAERSWRN